MLLTDRSAYQTTLKTPVTCSGVALHSGELVTLTMKPAVADTGVVFHRIDIPGEAGWVAARHELVSDTKLGTTLRNGDGVRIATVEHLMAALWGCGIDNVVIEMDGGEVPVMDGSSEPFVFLIECAGREELDAPRTTIEILREVSVEDNGSRATIRPHDGFTLDITIQFNHDAIGTQRALYDFRETSFKRAMSRARTFGFARDVEQLRSIGLARGGSLGNAVVLSEEGILNEEGLRYPDEFVRHKALDCIGDYFLAGGFIRGAVETVRPGHCINNKLLHALFADERNYRLVSVPSMSPARMAQPAMLAIA